MSEDADFNHGALRIEMKAEFGQSMSYYPPMKHYAIVITRKLHMVHFQKLFKKLYILVQFDNIYDV